MCVLSLHCLSFTCYSFYCLATTALILTASFQINLCIPVPECQTILNFAVQAGDDGDSSDDHQNSKTCKLLSNHHDQHISTCFFTGQMPFLFPNQQCQGTEGSLYCLDWHINKLDAIVASLSYVFLHCYV